MKVSELVSLLERLDPDSEVCFLPTNSYYPEAFQDEAEEDVAIRSFWGRDRKVTLLYGSGQVGGVQ